MSINVENHFKIALVHDWLLNVGGAEKTLKVLHEIFPSAPIYTLLYNKKFTDKFIPGADIRPSFLQKAYQLTGTHKLLTPFMPVAAESFDLSEFDLVISSSFAFSKGLILKPETQHICYCYSPMRQIWDWQVEYKKEPHLASGSMISLFQHFLRIWDRLASTRVDEFIAISENVRQRIKKYYRRDSTVIYPPVAKLPVANDYQARRLIENSKLNNGGFFLIVGRLFKHKNVDVAVKAFNKLGWPLVVIGEGPEMKYLRRLAGSNPNIFFLGYQPDDIIGFYYTKCLAFIIPQEEDFGITPIEAMSFGKPVLALKKGGALEYIQEGINGEFFEDPTEEVLADGARRLKEGIEAGKYSREIIKKITERFSIERFKREITEKIFNSFSFTKTTSQKTMTAGRVK
jgi:glycosyltransferase involved in cell wall biosynthesis